MGTAHARHVQHGKYIKTSVKNIKGRDHLKDLGVKWEDNNMNLREQEDGRDYIHTAQKINCRQALPQ
jgi:hypothetical protein